MNSTFFKVIKMIFFKLSDSNWWFSLQVADSYTDPLEIRVYIAALLIPLVLLGFVPNLKFLAPVSMVANGFMGIGLGITVYYLCTQLKPIQELELAGSPVDIPPFLCIVIFAMEAIGVVSIIFVAPFPTCLSNKLIFSSFRR